LHKPVRKKFPRKSYTVANIDDIWEMDLPYISSLTKYDNYKYLLNIRHSFTLCLERTSKGQDWYLNYSSFKILKWLPFKMADLG